MKKQILLQLSILIFAVSGVFAQTPPPKTITGGVINGKATSLPVPEFPAAAKAVKACGSINVQVLIDEAGNVASANAVSGHPLLRGASESAARQSTFPPTTLSGQPVKVSGIIVYKYACASEDENSASNQSPDDKSFTIFRGARIGIKPGAALLTHLTRYLKKI